MKLFTGMNQASVQLVRPAYPVGHQVEVLLGRHGGIMVTDGGGENPALAVLVGPDHRLGFLGHTIISISQHIGA